MEYERDPSAVNPSFRPNTSLSQHSLARLNTIISKRQQKELNLRSEQPKAQTL